MICKNIVKPHISLAHEVWQQMVQPDDIVVDATCGNGHDTLFLAQCAHRGIIHALDLQSEAIALTRERMNCGQKRGQIVFHNQCHSQFPLEIKPESVKVIVYNLGYLPGGDKDITTQVESSLQSIASALTLLRKNGLISITCYPGHDEGLREEKAILNFIEALSPRKWHCRFHTWPNRHRYPSLLFIQRID